MTSRIGVSVDRNLIQHGMIKGFSSFSIGPLFFYFLDRNFSSFDVEAHYNSSLSFLVNLTDALTVVPLTATANGASYRSGWWDGQRGFLFPLGRE